MNADMRPATSGYLITAPSAAERCYDLTVTVPQLRAVTGRTLRPWLKITANVDTQDVRCAAGITTVSPPEDDDGA